MHSPAGAKPSALPALGQFEAGDFRPEYELVSLAKHPERPKDSASSAKLVVDIAGGAFPNVPAPVVNAAAGRRGEARVDALSPKRRSAIAKKAAATRWNNG